MTFPNDFRFFLKETDFSWHRQYCWFSIKWKRHLNWCLFLCRNS
jgi:hypothetical protein